MKLYGGESQGDEQGKQADARKRRLNRLFGNVFAERLLLSLRKVDDPGTQGVISSLALNVTLDEAQGSTNSDMSGTATALESGEVKGRQRDTPNLEA